MWFDFSTIPPATRDARPERREQSHDVLIKAVESLTGWIHRSLKSRKTGLQQIVALIGQHEADLADRQDSELQSLAEELRLLFAQEGFNDGLVAMSFALVREAAGRTLGMRHFDCQLLGGLVLLKGMIAEMETGEGKTLTATLAAVTAAFAGLPVHVISVNDYLTRRDAEWMGPVYRFFGLTVGCVTHGLEPVERQAAYNCNITYCTNKEIVFDYLRDRMVLGPFDHVARLRSEALHDRGSRIGRLLLRGLVFAIVDEADSVLVDEARTPLIISGSTGAAEEKNFIQQAMELAAGLALGKDYLLGSTERQIELTDSGRQAIFERSEQMGPLWRGLVRREEMVRKALSACHLFARDEHYLVRDGKVQIVDEFTGRLMPDRSWERGLQQMVEIKEGCEPSSQRETLSRISYQRFFRRYHHLSGMTGTAREVAGELWSVYKTPVVQVPTHQPSQRIHHQDRVWPRLEEKWSAVLKRVHELHCEGRPILVGTRTVAASELLSRLFTNAGLPHEVLNARREEEEAEIVARAGEVGRITIATNMAGRGTDIKLDEVVKSMGGLHVLLTERHEAARIDRQLEGRCARQGDPGSFEAFVSLQDAILAGKGDWLIRFTPASPHLINWFGGKLIKVFQKRQEKSHARIRRELFKQDEQRGVMLSFSGRSE